MTVSFPYGNVEYESMIHVLCTYVRSCSEKLMQCFQIVHKVILKVSLNEKLLWLIVISDFLATRFFLADILLGGMINAVFKVFMFLCLLTNSPSFLAVVLIPVFYWD